MMEVFLSAFLKKDECFLIVVDIQERLHAAMEDQLKETYVKNSVILIETAKSCQIPIIVSEQYPKGLGLTIADAAGHLEGIPRHEKLFFSCYRDEGVKKAIKSTGKKVAVIIGIETHVCVMQTALDLFNDGYRVVIASDAVCSRRAHDRVTSLDAMARLGMLIYPTETIAFMFMEKAGTDLFKKLSGFFKLQH
jgi:nicotinamidase-related amidase